MHALGVEIDLDSQALEHVGGADPSADRAIAMLRDRHAGRRRDQRGAGRDVERASGVAAGSGRIEHIAAVEVERARPRAHCPRSAGKLGGGLALELERYEKAGEQRFGGLTVEDFAHHTLGTGIVERAAGEHRGKCFSQLAHGPTIRKKFASNLLPSGVPIDSGWNWMPSTASVR